MFNYFLLFYNSNYYISIYISLHFCVIILLNIKTLSISLKYYLIFCLCVKYIPPKILCHYSRRKELADSRVALTLAFRIPLGVTTGSLGHVADAFRSVKVKTRWAGHLYGHRSYAAVVFLAVFTVGKLNSFPVCRGIAFKQI